MTRTQHVEMGAEPFQWITNSTNYYNASVGNISAFKVKFKVFLWLDAFFIDISHPGEILLKSATRVYQTHFPIFWDSGTARKKFHKEI